MLSTALSGFSENPFTLRRAAPIGPPPTPKRARRPWLRLIVVLGVAAAGFGVWRVLRPSVHASASAVALAFYQALQHGDVTSAIGDVEPGQQSAAAASLKAPSVASFIQGNLHQVVVEPATTSPDSVGVSVVLQACNAGLSCSPLLAVPTVRVAGAWYVDIDVWLQTLAPAPVPPA